MEKRKLVIYLIIAALFYFVCLLLSIRADVIEKNYQFSGTIDKLSYSDKKKPAVFIKGKTYFISYPNEEFNNEIEVGDSLIKKKDSRIYKLIKKKGEVLFSN